MTAADDAWEAALAKLDEDEAAHEAREQDLIGTPTPQEYHPGMSPPPIADVVDARLESDAPVEVEGRACKKCGLSMGTGIPGTQRYHPECKPGAKHSGMSGEGTDPAGKQEERSTPASPKQRASSKKQDDLDKVRENAEMFIGMACGLARLAGPDIEPDLAIVMGARVNLAVNLRNVAEHEAWLRKALAGGSSTPRVMAWVGLIMTVGTVALPILARHGKLPGALAELGGMMDAGAGVAGSAA